ncbi:MAG: proton-conducting transporter membrane subunit [bacterium]
MIPLLIILVPLLTALAIIFLPADVLPVARVITFFSSLFVLILTIILFINYRPGYAGVLSGFLFAFDVPYLIEPLGSFLELGVDGLGLFFVILHSFIIFAAALIYIFNQEHEEKIDYIFLNFILSFANGLFLNLDLIVFYIFWELIFISGYYLQVYTRKKKLFSSFNKLLLPALASSFLLLIGIIFIHIITENQAGGAVSTISAFYQLELPPAISFWLFLSFGIPFFLRAGLFPFQFWLMSLRENEFNIRILIIALVLMKSAVYAFVRILIPFFPLQSFNRASPVLILAIIGILYLYLRALKEIRLASIAWFLLLAQPGFVLLGLFCMDVNGISAGLFLWFVQALAMIGLGFIFELDKKPGSAKKMNDYLAPRYYKLIVILSVLAAAGLPPAGPFAGYFLIFTSSLNQYPLLTVLAAAALIISAAQLLRFIKQDFSKKLKFEKISLVVLLALLLIIFVLGLRPGIILSRLKPTVQQILNEAVYFKSGCRPTILSPGQYGESAAVKTVNHNATG